MRMAARGEDGTAKAVKSDLDGNLGVTAKSVYTFGYISARQHASNTGVLRGEALNWRIGLGADHSCLRDGIAHIITDGNTDDLLKIQEVLNSDSLATTDAWIGIPIAVEGYRTFYTAITHQNGAWGIEVSAYLLPSVDGSLANGDIRQSLGWSQTLCEATELPSVSSNGRVNLSPGGLGRENFAQTPLGWLVIKLSATNNVGAGYLRIGVERQQ